MTGLKVKTMETGLRMVDELYNDNLANIADAWANTSDDEALTVSMNVKFALNKKQVLVIDIDAGISFVKERVKQSEHSEIDQRQEALPFGEVETRTTEEDGESDTQKPTHQYRLNQQKRTMREGEV